MQPVTKRFEPYDPDLRAEQKQVREMVKSKAAAVTMQHSTPEVPPKEYWMRFTVGEKLTITRERRGVIPVTRQVEIVGITEELLHCKPGIDFPIGVPVVIKGERMAVEKKGRNRCAFRPVDQSKPSLE